MKVSIIVEYLLFFLQEEGTLHVTALNAWKKGGINK